ncbi:phage integrase SAM-like domain-containing protein [Flagellimonas flava]|uniref:phage integrase SAM-like domain-containing protein n=1 Tax=Flagellimonas flava TaxID=570519 RepID=UPI001FE73509|nr:phage integrase SAM-like domain-containing protein [Allomuricauda flava]
MGYFLKSKRNCEHNMTIKYIVNFKKIIRIAYANEWISRDPFFHWKASWKTEEKQFLTQAELDFTEQKILFATT